MTLARQLPGMFARLEYTELLQYKHKVVEGGGSGEYTLLLWNFNNFNLPPVFI